MTSPEMPFSSRTSSARVTHSLDVLRLVEARDHDRDARSAAGGAGATSRISSVTTVTGISGARGRIATGRSAKFAHCLVLSGGTAAADTLVPVRICIVYDCLYPHTVGGAERWYRNLSRAARRRRARRHVPDAAPVGRGRGSRRPRRARGRGRAADGALRRTGGGGSGRRSSSGSASSGTCSGTAAATTSSTRRRFRTSRCSPRALVRPLRAVPPRRRLARALDRGVLARVPRPVGGRVGWAVQRLCLRIPQRAFCFSRLYERRLREEGVRGDVVVLEGQFEGDAGGDAAAGRAGRRLRRPAHPREAAVPALVPAIARAREAIPELRGEIYGDGPERPKVLDADRRARARRASSRRPASSTARSSSDALDRALCLVLPSRREGYGLVVLEAMSRGTPAVVVRGDDNAAAELIDEGENGFVAPIGVARGPRGGDRPRARGGRSASRVDARVVQAQRDAALARQLARRSCSQSYSTASARS